MKKIALSCLLFLALAIAAMAAAPVTQRNETVPRDISGVMDGRFTFEQWGPDWWDIYTHGDVGGTLRHLGLAKIYTTHTPHLDGTLSDGTFTIVAANGDKIWGTYEGSGFYISESQVLATTAFLIEGGTGRFARATGMITASFLETFDDPTFYSAKVTWSLVGTVSY